MSVKKIFNTETLVAAIKEIAEAISQNNGAEIKARIVQWDDRELRAYIIIEPRGFIAEERRRPPNE